MSPTAATYRCPDCGEEKLIPESPTTGPRYIRGGCPPCGRIRLFLRRDVWMMAQAPGVSVR